MAPNFPASWVLLFPLRSTGFMLGTNQLLQIGGKSAYPSGNLFCPRDLFVKTKFSNSILQKVQEVGMTSKRSIFNNSSISA